MGSSILLSGASIALPRCNSIQCSKRPGDRLVSLSSSNLRVSSRPRCPPRGLSQFSSVMCSFSSSEPPSDEDEEDPESPQVEALRVPDHWLERSRASKESEWLRVSLHKWLDDEYCPEDTNIDISTVAARSYHKSLMNKHTDLGEILIRMGRELESISYQDSFHGPYNAANAAIDLIAQRIEHESLLNGTQGSTISTG